MRAITDRYELRYVGFRNTTSVDDRTLRRAAAKGVLKQVRPGVYVKAAVWTALDHDDRYRLLVAATLEMSKGPYVASFRSAAALWDIPTLYSYKPIVDVLTEQRNGSRTAHRLHKHAVADAGLHLVQHDGLLLTSRERTVVDLARSRPFDDAVVAVDWALRSGIPRERLFEVLEEVNPVRDRRRAETAIAFGNGLAGSAGESESRVRIHDLGFPAPELQVEFTDHLGLIGFVDFYWSPLRLIGEFDGLVKYVDESMLRGRTPEQALVDEKRREDRLRGAGNGVTRWTKHELAAPGLLAAQLMAAGLRRERRAA